MTRPIALGLAAVLPLASAAAAATAGVGYQIRLNTGDQAAARAVVIRRADLGSSAWQGGPAKPDLSAGPRCSNYHPKVSDLVLTGAARTEFRQAGFDFGSQAGVLKTRRMVALDWRRSVLVPGAVSCLRKTTQKQLGSNATVVSFARLPFPHLAPHAVLFRGVIRVQAQGQTVRLLSDLVFADRNRTELTLSVVGPAQAKKQISAAEQRLARALIARARV